MSSGWEPTAHRRTSKPVTWSRSKSPASARCATNSSPRSSAMSRHSTAHHFLQGLVDLGIDYIFANLGTDHVSLIEAMAEWDRDGRKHPEMILCPHEVVAVTWRPAMRLRPERRRPCLCMLMPAPRMPAW